MKRLSALFYLLTVALIASCSFDVPDFKSNNLFACEADSDCARGFSCLEGRCIDPRRDVDECAEQTDDCGTHAACINTLTGFRCECEDGYAGDGTSCVNVDECALGTDTCDANATCSDTDGGFACKCNDGFTGAGTSCADIDECAPSGTNNCGANTTCTNLPGSFSCACAPGYEGDPLSGCTNIDECATQTDDCDVHATCIDTVGGYQCNCFGGYSGDGKTCVNVNECTTGGANCSSNASCTDTEGSFTCKCKVGYVGDGVSCSPADIATYVQDFGSNPLQVALEGIGTFDVFGLSRIGWEFAIVDGTPSGSVIPKDPGTFSYYDVTMRALEASGSEVTSLKNWMFTGANTVLASLTLSGADGESVDLTLSIKPKGGDPTITDMGAGRSRYAEAVFTVTAITNNGYQSPSGHTCNWPGVTVEIEGVTNLSCYANGELSLPAVASSAPDLWLPRVYPGDIYYLWSDSFRQSPTIRRSMSVVHKDSSGFETSRDNLFNTWPATIILFNPLRAIGTAPLFDVLVAVELYERG